MPDVITEIDAGRMDDRTRSVPPVTAVWQSSPTRIVSTLLPMIAGAFVILAGAIVDGAGISVAEPVEALGSTGGGESRAAASLGDRWSARAASAGSDALEPHVERCVTVACAEDRLTVLVNEARQSRGLDGLVARDDLVAVARQWSAVMAADGVMRHNDERFDQTCCWIGLAENVAVYTGDGGLDVAVIVLHRALMRSPGHRANILWEPADEIGIGIEVTATGKVWVTQLFRAHDDVEVSPRPGG